jgi:hypothetical protein
MYPPPPTSHQLRSGGVVILQHNQFVHPFKDDILRSRIGKISTDPKSEDSLKK